MPLTATTEVPTIEYYRMVIRDSYSGWPSIRAKATPEVFIALKLRQPLMSEFAVNHVSSAESIADGDKMPASWSVMKVTISDRFVPRTTKLWFPLLRPIRQCPSARTQSTSTVASVPWLGARRNIRPVSATLLLA